MHRRELLIIALLVMPLVGHDVAWAVALRALADGSHQMSLRPSAGHLDVVLHHGSADHWRHDEAVVETDSSRDEATAFTRHSHAHGASSHHQDHIVQLPGSPCSSLSATKRPHATCTQLALALDTEWAMRFRAPVTPGVACLTGIPAPPGPSRSSILRI